MSSASDDEQSLETEGAEHPQSQAPLWDPLNCPDWDAERLSSLSINRIQRDLISLRNSPCPGIILTMDENLVTKMHVLITGPLKTPYEGGFFYFVLRCPPDYPLNPPRVRLMTTSSGRVRFNPNLYRNGKVCLSILGTWSGPSWMPVQNLSTLLMSIQSLMTEKPLHNEPGFEESEPTPGDSQRYNDIIQHETLRVAVCETLEGSPALPSELRRTAEKLFLNDYAYYTTVCQSKNHLNGQPMQDPFGDRRGVFDYTNILSRLENLYKQLKDHHKQVSDELSSSSDSSSSLSDEENNPDNS